MSPYAKRALARRDDFLQKHGFPDNPEWGTFVDGLSKPPVQLPVDVPKVGLEF